MIDPNLAEQAVLGAMMLSASAAAEIRPLLTGASFRKPAHELIWNATTELHDNGIAPDPVTVAAALSAAGNLAQAGGAIYLYDLTHHVPAAATGAHYAELVHGYAQLREISAVGVTLQQAGDSEHTDPTDIPDLLLAAIRRLEAAADRVTVETAPLVSDLLDAVLDGIEKPSEAAFIHTGLPDLDDLYPGHSPGQLVIVGARPSVGKSVLALTLARAAAADGAHTLLVSLEMSSAEVMRRLLAAESGVDLGHIMKGTCTDYDWDRLAAATARVAEIPLRIDDSSTVGLPQLRATLSRHKRTGNPVRLLIVDYIQLMTAPRAENRQQSVAELSRGLKLLAGEFGIPVIALAQLNRESERRQSKRPTMSDLRESGALEQDADSIILMHREELHGTAENPIRPGECDLIVEKCRAGRPGTVTVLFQGHYARCVSYAKPWTPHTALRSVA